MVDTSSDLFTVGVFQDAAWAEKGLEALQAQGFSTETLSLIALDSPEVVALCERVFGTVGPAIEIRALGPARARGPIVDALQGPDRSLTGQGIAASARRIGFQAHDGRIFEVLTSRGGVLVATTGEDRAADALAVLHAYGGGNAAIGAWGGRV